MLFKKSLISILSATCLLNVQATTADNEINQAVIISQNDYGESNGPVLRLDEGSDGF